MPYQEDRNSPSAPNQTPTHSVGADGMWREKYLSARRRSRIFASTTVVALAVAGGAVVWGVNQQPEAPAAVAAGASVLGDQSGPPEGFGPGSGVGTRGVPLEELFTADGAVSADAVEEFLATVPEGFDPTRVIERGLLRGALTQEQADALLGAFAAAGATEFGDV